MFMRAEWLTGMLIVPLMLAGCTDAGPAVGDGLGPAQVAAADALPDIDVSLEDIVLPSGESVLEYLDEGGEGKVLPELDQKILPQERRKRVISAMSAKALKLCKRTDWQFQDEGLNKPEQNGLAYLWGGKNHLVRQDSTTDACPEFLYGLDCSGMLYQCSVGAGLAIMVGPVLAQEIPENWNAIIPADWGLRMELASDAVPQTGDIISWGNHVGIIGETTDGGLVVFQSNGAPNATDCVKNYSATRGPRTFTLQGAKNSFGATYKLLRLVAEISGDWNVYLRCEGQTGDAIVIAFTIDNRNGGVFSASGSGTDYDGSPFTADLIGTYDAITNRLEGTIDYALAGGVARVDGIDIVLDFDTTDYFPLEKVVDNGGCYVDARLERVDEEKVVEPPTVQVTPNDGPRIGGL